MTIQELIDEAVRLDPKLRIKVYDSIEYAPSRYALRVDRPLRHTVVSVSHQDHGEGSGEDILLVMRDKLVADVVPGTTTQHWQVAALIKALDASRDAREIDR